MADVDFSNPFVVITGFFAVFITAMMFLVKIVQFGVLGGLGMALIGLLGFGAVWGKTFGKK